MDEVIIGNINHFSRSEASHYTYLSLLSGLLISDSPETVDKQETSLPAGLGELNTLVVAISTPLMHPLCLAPIAQIEQEAVYYSLDKFLPGSVSRTLDAVNLSSPNHLLGQAFPSCRFSDHPQSWFSAV